jgi:ketosteroid isomerase-like protein
MSQENVEVVRRMNAAFNSGDLDAAFDLYDPAAIWHSRSDEPDTGDYHGRQAIRGMAEMWRAMFDDFQIHLDDFVDARNCVVTCGWVAGRGRDSGAEVRDPYAWVVRLEDGKITEIWEYRDRAEALEAVGLRE